MTEIPPMNGHVSNSRTILCYFATAHTLATDSNRWAIWVAENTTETQPGRPRRQARQTQSQRSPLRR